MAEPAFLPACETSPLLSPLLMLERISHRLFLYSPRSMALPADCDLAREQPERSLGLKRDRGLGSFYHKKFEITHDTVEGDYRTIFYDVFRTPDDGKIVALGPAMKNLEAYLMPPEVLLEGKPCKYKYEERGNYGQLAILDPIKLGFLEIKLPHDLRQREELKLEFRWKSFNEKVTVPRNPFRQHEAVQLSLTTIQKDYPDVWIRDWCNYYHRAHGVQRVVLYDNGSRDINAVLEALAGVDESLQCVLMKWPFPFGLIGARYCQQGSLNHCYQIFGNLTQYHLNFDLDEYLVNLTDKNLAQYLARSLRFNAVSLLITQYRVPWITGEGQGAQYPRAFDFKYRSKVPWHYGTRTKTVYKSRHARFISNHSVSTHVPPPIRQMFAKSRILWALAMRARLPIPGMFFQKRASYNQLYFNHYAGLNSGWKVKIIPKSPDPRTEELDPVMPGVLEKVGIRADSQ